MNRHSREQVVYDPSLLRNLPFIPAGVYLHLLRMQDIWDTPSRKEHTPGLAFYTHTQSGASVSIKVAQHTQEV